MIFAARRVCFAALLLATSDAYARNQVAVYLTTNTTVPELERALRADDALKELEPIVYSKFSEFLAAQEAESARVVIVPAAFLKYHKGYQPVLQLTREGKTEQPYLLLSVHPKWGKTATAQGAIGVVDEVGRDPTKQLVEEIAGELKFARVKLVKRVKDLVLMLALDDADYIYISPENYENVKETFSVKTTVVDKSLPVGFPVVCVRDTDPKAAAEAVAKLGPKTLAILGFDGVKPYVAKAAR